MTKYRPHTSNVSLLHYSLRQKQRMHHEMLIKNKYAVQRLFLPRDVMHKRGLCRYAVSVSVCVCVCLSVCL